MAGYQKRMERKVNHAKDLLKTALKIVEQVPEFQPTPATEQWVEEVKDFLDPKRRDKVPPGGTDETKA